MKFSLIMPHLPNRTTIYRAVESVEKQSYLDWELLIVADGKPEAGALDHRIKIIESRQTCDYGNSQRNIALQKATGEYIVYIDDDNQLGDLMKLQEALIRHDKPELLIGRVDYPLISMPRLPFYYPELGKIDGMCIVIKESLKGERWKGSGRDSDFNYIMRLWERAETKVFDNSVLIGTYGGAGFGELF